MRIMPRAFFHSEHYQQLGVPEAMLSGTPWLQRHGFVRALRSGVVDQPQSCARAVHSWPAPPGLQENRTPLTL
jgi:hypothetical protein